MFATVFGQGHQPRAFSKLASFEVPFIRPLFEYVLPVLRAILRVFIFVLVL